MLSVKNISKTYVDHKALDNISINTLLGSPRTINIGFLILTYKHPFFNFFKINIAQLI